MNLIFRVEYASGRVDKFASYSEAYDSVKREYPEAAIGHNGDLNSGGARTYCWEDETESINDDGSKAIAAISSNYSN